MPYKVRKQKCRQKSGKRGSYTLSYKTKSGESRRICHTSKKKAKRQIAAIEMRETFSRDLLEYIAEVVKFLDLSESNA